MHASRSLAAITLLSVVCARGAWPQSGRTARTAATAVGEIRGRLADSVTGRPIGGGSITVRRLGDSLFAGGTLPAPDGRFRVDGLAPGSYSVRIRALGYEGKTRTGVLVSAERPVLDLGTIRLTVVARRLAEREVVAERDDQILAPDRNTYDVRNMTTAAGGSALDVLRNVPAVEVDGNNRVRLRGNANVVVQVNGRSTPLSGEELGSFLSQLPTNLIRHVEVATNPSARSDPEGTAGIVNIVLDQRAELALSGALTASASTTRQVNLSGNVGRQRGPLTLFLSGTAYRDRRATRGLITRTNLLEEAVPAYVETRLTGRQTPRSAGGTLRSEYRVGAHSALTLDGSLFTARYGRAQSSSYVDLDPARAVIGLFDQRIDQLSRVASQHLVLGFHRQGPPTALQGRTELEYWNNGNVNDADRAGRIIRADASTPASIDTERDRLTSRFWYVNVKSDHTKSFDGHGKLEAGLRVTTRTTTTDLDASSAVSDGRYAIDTVRSTALDYRESIAAAYAVLSRQLRAVQAQGGLRLEGVETLLRVPTSSARYDGGYRSAFPSAAVVYGASPRRQLRLSYSRRVSRPNPTQLTPVEHRIDTRNVVRGNPELRPEYTNAMELSLNHSFAWGSLQLVPYLRQASQAVRNIQFVDSVGVSVNTFRNVASTRTVGSDLNVTVRRGPLTLLAGGLVHRYSSDAGNLGGDLSVRTVVWQARSNLAWRLSPRADVQLTSNYRAPYATEGGATLAFATANVALRYKAWGDDGSVSLRFADPFGMERYGYRTANGSVIELSERYNGTRAVFFAVTRTFGRPLRLRSQAEAESQGSGGAP